MKRKSMICGIPSLRGYERTRDPRKVIKEHAGEG